MRRHPTAREGEVPGPPVRSIGPYEAVALLGKGSNGTVLLARRAGVERLFAVKLLPASVDPEGLARLRREAALASRLEHPGLVQVHDVGEHQGQAYLVMDHVPGPTLKERLARDGPLPSREAATLVADLAEAVAVAHAAGIVHRDLKPANVILDGRDGRPRVTDFGLARDLSAPSQLTREGAVLGTPYYMSPEQVRGETADARSDVHALGVILFELLTGQRPYQAKDVSDLSWKILQGRPPAPRSLRADVDPGIEAVCRQAMAPAREARHASAAELAAALRAACAAPRASSSPPGPAAAAPRGGAGPRRVGPRAALVLAAAGGLVSVALATWVLAERLNAADLQAEVEALAAQAEARDAAAARAGPAAAALTAAEAELARLEDEARARARALAERREADARAAAARARPDGHLGQLVDAAVARLAEVPGTAALRARLLRNRGRWDEALEVVARARAGGDRDPELPLLAALVEAARGRQEQAEQALRELLALPADTPQGAFARAVDVSLGPEAALAVLDRGLRAAPAPYLHLRRARVLRQAGEREGRLDLLRAAVEAAGAAIDADPTDPDGYGERYAAMLSLMLREEGAAAFYGPRALADVRAARELRPVPDMWVDAAIALAALDLPRPALAEVEAALAQGLTGAAAARAHVWRGHALAMLGEEGEAVREWREGRLEQLSAASLAVHARWLARVSPAARDRALEGAPAMVRAEVERVIAALAR